MAEAMGVFILGTVLLGCIVGVMLKASRMGNSTPVDWDVDQDELRPQTPAEARRYGYTGERCPSCYGYRMVTVQPDHGLWDIKCLECGGTWPARI